MYNNHETHATRAEAKRQAQVKPARYISGGQLAGIACGWLVLCALLGSL